MTLSKQKKSILSVSIVLLLCSVGLMPSIHGSTPYSSMNLQEINEQQALSVATAKIIELEKHAWTVQELHTIHSSQEQLLAYLFVLQPTGYIVVAACYDLPPIFCYSFTNKFGSFDATNPLYTLLVADSSLRLDNLALVPKDLLKKRHEQWNALLTCAPTENRLFEQRPPEGTTPTGGWLLANWHQNAPYNNFCPLDLVNGGRSVAGCPAVAMAMILDYHKTTQAITFSDADDYYHNYAGNTYWIDNNYQTYGFPSFPQLNTYMATAQQHYNQNIPLTADDKAAITFACGVAAKQVYNAGGSGTFGVQQAYNAYLRFNCSSVSLLTRTYPYLHQRLSQNMKDAQPAHLAVVNPPWTMGHNVVVDGYNTDEFYHINFGWGGTYNGWYHIPDDIPYGLTVIEGLIVDILTEESTHPVLSCTGSLSWGLVQPGETLTSTLLLSNAGEPESLLDWSVISHPSWGTWSITPSFGYDLTPEHGGCFPSLGSLKATFRLGMLIWVLKIVFVKRVFPSNESITSQATDN